MLYESWAFGVHCRPWRGVAPAVEAVPGVRTPPVAGVHTFRLQLSLAALGTRAAARLPARTLVRGRQRTTHHPHRRGIVRVGDDRTYVGVRRLVQVAAELQAVERVAYR